MLEKKVWAIVGVSPKADNYGNMIFNKLSSRGYKVYAVNPLYTEVNGKDCYKALTALPEKPDVINMVVAPKRGRAYLEEAKNLGIKYVWFQPGASDEDLIKYAKELGFEYAEACVLVATR